MQFKKKERLYIADLLTDPAITYPAYYTLSTALCKNEMLHETLRAIHSCDFTNMIVPNSFEEIFAALEQGIFAVYKEKYAVGYFGGKLMYLETQGWKSFPVTRDVFTLDNWLI